MEVGSKIRNLRMGIHMSQQKLAAELNISQATLHHIESDNHHKIDFALMDKICNIFDKDRSYFMNENVTVNNNYPESILAEIQQLIDENKLLKAEIAELKEKK